METPPGPGQRTVVAQMEPVALGNADPNANWGSEPNFNLNLTLTPPSRVATDTRRSNGRTGRKGVAAETERRSAREGGEEGGGGGRRSRIPALARSPKSPDAPPHPRHTHTHTPHPAPSPRTHTHTHRPASQTADLPGAGPPSNHGPRSGHAPVSPRTNQATVRCPGPAHTSSPKCRTTVAVTMRGTKAEVEGGGGPLVTPHNTAEPVPMATTPDPVVVPEVSEFKMAVEPKGEAGGPTPSQNAVQSDALPGPASDESHRDDPVPSPWDAEPAGDPGRRGDVDVIVNGDLAASPTPTTEEKKEATPSSGRRDAGTMTDPQEEASSWAGERREVGVQAAVEVCDREVNTHSHTPANGLLQPGPCSALIGLPDCQSEQEAGSVEQSRSRTCVSIGRPPFQHVCQIDMELRSQSELGVEEQQPMREEHGPEPIEAQDREEEKVKAEAVAKVAWDARGLTWQVHGAELDLGSLGVAIQSHLERRLSQSEKHLGTLRRSVCAEAPPPGGRGRGQSEAAPPGGRGQRKKRRSLFRCVFRPGCCRRTASATQD